MFGVLVHPLYTKQHIYADFRVRWQHVFYFKTKYSKQLLSIVFKYIVVVAVLINCDTLKLPGLLEEEKSWAGVAGTAEELGFTA